MRIHLPSLTLCASLAASAIAQTQTPPPAPPETPNAQGWVGFFADAKLDGWTSPDNGNWEVAPDGVLTGTGPTSHLFSPGVYTNLEFKVEVKLNHKGNSGMYVRAAYAKSWPKGYEAQVCNTCPDPQKTGGLYNLNKELDQLVADDTWWTQHVIAIGNRIIIKVNDKIVTDFVDEKATYKSGHLALQQHDPGSVVNYRKVMVKRLADNPKAALAEARKDMPDLK